MWRAFLLAIGFYVMLVGIQSLGVETITLRIHDNAPQEGFQLFASDEPKLGPLRQIALPPWAPWSLLSTGAVMCLYSFTISQRFGGG